MIKNILNNFVDDYINYINSDIYKAAAYYKHKDKHIELKELNLIKSAIYNSVSNNFKKIMNISDAIKITRLGDMHARNNCTLLIEFKNKKIIYKPFHSHFLNLINQILQCLNLSNKFNFYCLKLIFQNKNGSFIEYLANETPNDLSVFSFHYGAIIFIITLLRGTDFHSDNIFCNSSIPIILDYETFFYPKIVEFKDYCVEATSLIKTENNKQTLMHSYNLNVKSVIDGINSACNIIKNNENKIFSLVNKYKEMITRVIFKPTSYYMSILKNSTHPSLLCCKPLRKKYLEDCLTGRKNISLCIINHEIEDLLTFNIPNIGAVFWTQKKVY